MAVAMAAAATVVVVVEDLELDVFVFYNNSFSVPLITLVEFQTRSATHNLAERAMKSFQNTFINKFWFW